MSHALEADQSPSPPRRSADVSARSAGSASEAAATSPLPAAARRADVLKTHWRRCKFQISWVLTLLPLVYLISYFDTGMKSPARTFETLQVGPWTATLMEEDADPPHRRGDGRLTKTYLVRFCDDCRTEIRGAFISVGKPTGKRLPGALLHGNPYAWDAHLVFPKALDGAATIWLTAEGWDGSVHHAAWPLPEDTARAAGYIGRWRGPG